MTHVTKMDLFLLVYLCFSSLFAAASPILDTVDFDVHPEQIVLSNDLRWLAFTTLDGIYLHDRINNESFTLYESDDFPQLTIALSSDNEHLVYGSPMGVSLYNLATKTIKKLPFPTPSVVAFSPDGKLLLIAIKNELYIWDFTSNNKALQFKIDESEKLSDDIICALVMNSDNQMIIIGTKSGDIHHIAVNQSCTAAILYSSLRAPGRAQAFCFGPDNMSFYCVGPVIRAWNCEVRVHNKHGGKNLSFTSMVYNPETEELFATTYDGKVWYISGLECISYSCGTRSTPVRLFASADGLHVALVKATGIYESKAEIYPLTQKSLALACTSPCYVLKASELTLKLEPRGSKPEQATKKQRTS